MAFRRRTLSEITERNTKEQKRTERNNIFCTFFSVGGMRHANNVADFRRPFRTLGLGTNYPARCAGLISDVAPRPGVLPKAEVSDLIRLNPAEREAFRYTARMRMSMTMRTIGQAVRWRRSHETPLRGPREFWKNKARMLPVFRVFGADFGEAGFFQPGTVEQEEDVQRDEDEEGHGKIQDGEAGEEAEMPQIHGMPHPAIRAFQDGLAHFDEHAEGASEVDRCPDVNAQSGQIENQADGGARGLPGRRAKVFLERERKPGNGAVCQIKEGGHERKNEVGEVSRRGHDAAATEQQQTNIQVELHPDNLAENFDQRGRGDFRALMGVERNQMMNAQARENDEDQGQAVALKINGHQADAPAKGHGRGHQVGVGLASHV